MGMNSSYDDVDDDDKVLYSITQSQRRVPAQVYELLLDGTSTTTTTTAPESKDYTTNRRWWDGVSKK